MLMGTGARVIEPDVDDVDDVDDEPAALAIAPLR
jgi:hypothetical protein